jgi:hypothetical protein
MDLSVWILAARMPQAVVNITTVVGGGPMPGCGVFFMHALVLEKTANGWRTLIPLGGVIS